MAVAMWWLCVVLKEDKVVPSAMASSKLDLQVSLRYMVSCLCVQVMPHD